MKTAIGAALVALQLAALAAWADTGPALDDAARARLEHIVRTRGFTRGIPRNPMPSPTARRSISCAADPRISGRHPSSSMWRQASRGHSSIWERWATRRRCRAKSKRAASASARPSTG
jgi:hypothetical protein